MTTATATKSTATDRQIALVNKLLGEKFVSDESRAFMEQEFAEYASSIKVCSKMIGFLISLPYAGGAAEAAAKRFVPEPGVYLMDGAVYRVKISRAGHWYAEQATKPGADSTRKSLKWDYVGKRVDLADAQVLTDAEAGQFLVYCIRCGKELTVKESIERGMGPVCAKA